MLYRRIELPPEPWTHEDNPEWILVDDFSIEGGMYLLVPVEPCAHGNYDRHQYSDNPWRPNPDTYVWCEGAALKGDT